MSDELFTPLDLRSTLAVRSSEKRSVGGLHAISCMINSKMASRLEAGAAWSAENGVGPVYDGYFADPFVFRHAGLYYAIGTGPAAGGRELPMLRSPDFFRWEPIGWALERPPVEGDCYWAPEIAYWKGLFYLYYSVGMADKGHQLRVATSRDPAGPYQDSGAPLLDPETCGFAIDASPFQDADGRWYLFYCRDFLDSENGARPGTALVVGRLNGMTCLTSEFEVVMRARHDWQRFQASRPIYGGIYDWHTLEGPFVVRHEGRYYCFYSGGNWQNDTYGVDWVWSHHPLGPYTDDNPGDGARLLSSIPGQLGPGHNSVVVGPDGETPFIAYHAWDPQMTGRRMHLARLRWQDGRPVCVG